MSDSVLTENLMEFLYGIDGVIGFKLNNNSYYYKKNLQGDIIGIYNSDLQLIAKYAYDAWGNHKISYLEGSNFVDFNNESSYTNTSNNNLYIALKNPFRYRSYYYDHETSLYYLNSRYYDPRTGRFINVDEIEILENTNNFANGLNLYAYCLNNPVNDIDSEGNLSWWQKLLIGLGVLIVGAFITAITAGTGTGFWAAFGSALLTSTIQTGISAGISAGIGLIAGGISTGTFEGALNGFFNGFVDGLMWGGIFSGGAQILGGIIPKTTGFKIGNHEFFYGTSKSKTLISINNKLGSSRFRIDIGAGSKTTKLLSGIHFHFGATSKIRRIHRFFFPSVINGFIIGIIRILNK